MRMQLNVNGKVREVEADPDTPLLWILRDDLELTGTKYGCGIAYCGACTVHVDGMARRACCTPVGSVEKKAITTIEGLDSKAATAVQSAWVKHDVPQCGFCQSGQVMSAVALLSKEASPSDEDIDRAMTGNICRCATYVRIKAAVKDAAAEMKG